MEKVQTDETWRLVKQFEEGVTFFTKEGSDRYTPITTLPDLLRYQYRLYLGAESTDKKYVIFDLDGTISLTRHRDHFLESTPRNWNGFFDACSEDGVNTPVVELLKWYGNAGYKIVIITGRSNAVAEKTECWLHENAINYDEIFMRPSNDWSGDAIFKKATIDTRKLTPENTVAVFDDRDSMVKKWREWGFTCFQVAAGDF